MPARSRTQGRARRAAASVAFLVVAFLVVRLPATQPDAVPSRFHTANAQDHGAWTPLPRLETRFGHSALYDAASRRMPVLVGASSFFAQSDAAVLDLASLEWSALATTGMAPQPRTGVGPIRGSGVAFDALERVAVLECDCAEGSTYLFDLSEDRWSLAPNDESLHIVGGTMAYDTVGDRVVLLGGREYGISSTLAAAYAYDMSEARAGWTELPDPPFAIADAAAVFVEPANEMLVFGGQTDDGAFLNSLWRLDAGRMHQDDAWSDITALAGQGPTGRVGASLVYVPDLRSVVLYGGYAPGDDNNDVWVLDYAEPASPNWTLVASTTAGAGSRSAHSAIWDEHVDRMIVYGGTRGEGRAVTILDDAWALPAGALTPGPMPTPTVAQTETPEAHNLVALPALYRGASP